MTKRISLEPSPAGDGSSPPPGGSISLTSFGGSLAWSQFGRSPARVEWKQGNPPMGKAQFMVQRAAHIPRRPAASETTDLTVGDNTILFSSGPWDDAQIFWTYSGGMGEPGAATFSSSMEGPVGPSSWNTVAEVIGPQQANFQIAFAAEPTSLLLHVQLESTPATVRPILVRVSVDGVFAATLADGCEIAIKGQVVTLGLDIRPDNVTDAMVQFELLSQ